MEMHCTTRREINLSIFGTKYLSTPCMVCEDPIPSEEWEMQDFNYNHRAKTKICDKCKAAILYMREQMKNGTIKEN